MTKKIIFSTGGTGGHIFPAINLMKHFADKKYEVVLITDNRGNSFIKNNSEFYFMHSYGVSIFDSDNVDSYLKVSKKKVLGSLSYKNFFISNIW